MQFIIREKDMAKVCDVCGKPSGMYPICRTCFKLRDEGKVIKCDECGKWHYANEKCSCNDVNEFSNSYITEISSSNTDYEPTETATVQNDNICIVCGESAPNGPQCRECYYESKSYTDEFDKNLKPFELRDYYFNLKSNIYRMFDFEKVKSNCNKLMALALLLTRLYDDDTLSDRICNDIKDIIIAKTPRKEQNITEYARKQDSQKENIIRTLDGHVVKSHPEQVIDDCLYNSRIIHCYEKKVSEISNAERTVMCDWFMPVLDNSHGIYIEYWGMNSGSYNKNKEEKRALYKKYNAPLIEIEKDEYIDTQGLCDRILMEIKELKAEYYGIVEPIKNRNV